jgi:hypothetical protein
MDLSEGTPMARFSGRSGNCPWPSALHSCHS